MLKKSPSGSLCPYYYKGGELQPLHYGSYHSDLVKLFRVMDAEEAFILQSHGGRKVWIDLYETDMTNAFYEKLTRHLITIGHKLFKLALCGRLEKIAGSFPSGSIKKDLAFQHGILAIPK